MAQRQIIGGGFQDALGNKLASGYITLRLNTDAVTGTGAQLAAGRLVRVSLDINGDISGTVLLWPNDQMTPTDTVYIVRVYSVKGQLAWSSEQVIPSGVGSYDITAWVA
jgi:hypothetical protein